MNLHDLCHCAAFRRLSRQLEAGHASIWASSELLHVGSRRLARGIWTRTCSLVAASGLLLAAD